MHYPAHAMRGLREFLRHPVDCVAALALFALAELDLRRGNLAAARRRLQRCARLVPGSFRVRFGLGRLYLVSRDEDLARRELSAARRLAPERYLARRLELPVGFRDDEPVAVVAPPAPAAVAVREPAPWGDCRDAREWERLRALGPIRDDEVRSVDWDRLLARIGRSDVDV